MRILVIHQNFPGQFAHFVTAWAKRPGWDVRGLGRDTAPGLAGFAQLTRYRLGNKLRGDQHPYLRQIESSTLHGQAAARAMLAMKQAGFTPDVILAHPGWGETLFVKDVFPHARLVHFCEWYYSADGADLGFDPEFPLSLDDRARIRMWNAQHTLDLVQCDAAVSPTAWQRSRYPAVLQHKIVVQHEGIATANLAPCADAAITTPNGTTLRAGDPVVTYVARNLEPYRGFHVFLRALERLQKTHPHCHALIVGGDNVSYGPKPKNAANWRTHMLGQVALDAERTHFVGKLPYADYVRVLQISAAHVYLTYPFVLSWSLLEAMACGAPLVASDTPPVREVLRSGHNAKLAPFFDIAAIADGVTECLHATVKTKTTRRQAQSDAQRFRLDAGLAGYERVMGIDNFTEKTLDHRPNTQEKFEMKVTEHGTE